MTRPMQRDAHPTVQGSNVAAWPGEPTARAPTPSLPPRPSFFPNIRADFAAHGRRWGAQGFWALVIYRFGRWRYGVKPAPLRKAFSALYHVLFKLVQIITGIELPCEVPIGRNFVIDHHGGIIVSGYTKFGDNCRIRSGVVIGLSRKEDPCAPVIGSNVDIGAGAKLLGRITIGDNVTIGANAVVVRDVPPNCVAMGVPAVVKAKRSTQGEPSGTMHRLRRVRAHGVDMVAES
jgi:serine O-acetyltransferase